MELGLRNKYGSDPGQVLNLPIKVTVNGPSGSRDVLTTYLQSDQWADVHYPASPYDMASGIHTVIWQTADGRYLACSGFVVEELQGE